VRRGFAWVSTGLLGLVIACLVVGVLALFTWLVFLLAVRIVLTVFGWSE
jgi:hypothetical protein